MSDEHALAPQEQPGAELMIEPSSIVQGGPAAHMLEDDVHHSPVDSSHSEVPHKQASSLAVVPSVRSQTCATKQMQD